MLALRSAAIGLIAAALTVQLVAAQTARPEAPTTVADVPWGATLADVKRLRPEAACRVDHVEDFRRPQVETKYDMERGALTTTMPVRFSAACFWQFNDEATGEGEVTLNLQGEPPTFQMAYITYKRPDYARVRQSFIDLYGQPDERLVQSLSWFNRVRVWIGRPSVEAEELTWTRPHATVTLSHPEYAHLGRKSGKPFVVLRAIRRP
jgi:hypothetical protein